ncbi:hypothetical protein EDD16DRAFT_1731709, partial [Pisolithus croceorrhizus]
HDTYIFDAIIIQANHSGTKVTRRRGSISGDSERSRSFVILLQSGELASSVLCQLLARDLYIHRTPRSPIVRAVDGQERKSDLIDC